MAKAFVGRSFAICLGLAAVGLPGAAHAQKPAIYHGLTFPETIAGAQIGEPRNFELQHPGLGYSVEYKAPGWVIDVYIYDMGRSTIPADLASEPLVGELRQAIDDVVRRPNAVNVRIKLHYALLDDKIRTRFICTSFSYSDPVTPVDSYLCVTSWNNKFVKYRLTTSSRAGSDVAANEFMQAWIPVLWTP